VGIKREKDITQWLFENYGYRKQNIELSKGSVEDLVPCETGAQRNNENIFYKEKSGGHIQAVRRFVLHT
jgi:hypothetical protein